MNIAAPCVLVFLLSYFTLAASTNINIDAYPKCYSDMSSEDECEDSNHLGWPWDNWGKPTTPSDGPPFKVKYFLYKNPSNKEQYEEIFIHDKMSVTKANPVPQAPWKILAHGFTNDKDSPFPKNVRNAYLDHLNKEPLNILVYDWGDGAKVTFRSLFNILKLKGIYQEAVENTRPAGLALGNMIEFLHKEGVLNISTTHLIGHSLGAHVAGHAARQVKNRTDTLIWRISALDPAGPLFWNNNMLWWLHNPYPRIHRNRAAFVDVYHTSRKFGSADEMGDIDFYVNGGKEQPSCAQIYFDTRRQICSHAFATEIFAKSINDPTMKACTGCYNYADFLKENATCNGECEDWPVFGEYVDRDKIEGYPVASGEAFIRID